MYRKLLIKAAVPLIGLGLWSNTALANWVLDSADSTLHFVSIKKGHVADVHALKTLSGELNPEGEGKLSIDLNSLDSGIEIRDQRMRDLLFEVGKFAKATVTLNLQETSIKPGMQTIKALLDLHGKQQEISANVMVIETAERLYVHTTAPVILNAEDFDLAAGITTLREIAGLDSISNAVPVTFSLSFQKQQP